jgi:hypothetical protein
MGETHHSRPMLPNHPYRRHTQPTQIKRRPTPPRLLRCGKRWVSPILRLTGAGSPLLTKTHHPQVPLNPTP